MSAKDGELPAELDFFKYAAAGPSKRNPSEPGSEDHAKKKRRKRENSIDQVEDPYAKDNDDGANGLGSEQGTTPPMPKQRVTTKGKNVPERINTFKELQDRYNLASQLMVNLERNGYKYPTGIQSSGCPILFEVGPPFTTK
jgi:ATP-dependent RNA helicase DDX52/ROK1